MSYRASVIHMRGEEGYEFDDFMAALDWGWGRLKRHVTWGEHASFQIVKDGELVCQFLATERVGMYSRADEQYTRPRPS